MGCPIPDFPYGGDNSIPFEQTYQKCRATIRPPTGPKVRHPPNPVRFPKNVEPQGRVFIQPQRSNVRKILRLKRSDLHGFRNSLP